MEWSILPKYEQKIVLAIFHLYFGRNDDFINSFWNLLTFSLLTETRKAKLGKDRLRQAAATTAVPSEREGGIRIRGPELIPDRNFEFKGGIVLFLSRCKKYTY